MNPLKKFLSGIIRPQVIVKRVVVPSAAGAPPRNVNSANQNYYEALRDTPDRSKLIVGSQGFRRLVTGLNRQALSAVSEYLYDNNGSVSYAVDTIANYSVPIKPMAASPDPSRNRAYDEYWAEWEKRADFTGRFHFDTLQRLACKGLDIDGDSAFIPTIENGTLQVVLIEGWRINSIKAQEDYIVDGVRIDSKGRVLGYYLRDYYDTNKPLNERLVPASEMFLIYDPDRISNYRGSSPIRRGSNDIRDVTDIKAFSKLAAKIGSSIAATLTTEDAIEEDVWGNDTGNQDGTIAGNSLPSDATEEERKITVAELLGGEIKRLKPGEKVELLQNTHPGDKITDFMVFLSGCFVQGLGLPPAFYLDEKLTGPNSRAVNGKAQRKFDQRQAQLARFITWLWPRVIAWGIENDGLPDGEGFEKCEWQGPAKLTIDAGREMAQEREDVAGGLMTRQEHYGSRSLNWKRETLQGLDEDEFIILECQERAKRLGVPVEVLLARRGFDTKSAEPKPDDQEESGKEESDEDKEKKSEEEGEDE